MGNEDRMKRKKEKNGESKSKSANSQKDRRIWIKRNQIKFNIKLARLTHQLKLDRIKNEETRRKKNRKNINVQITHREIIYI